MIENKTIAFVQGPALGLKLLWKQRHPTSGGGVNSFRYGNWQRTSGRSFKDYIHMSAVVDPIHLNRIRIRIQIRNFWWIRTRSRIQLNVSILTFDRKLQYSMFIFNPPPPSHRRSCKQYTVYEKPPVLQKQFKTGNVITFCWPFFALLVPDPDPWTQWNPDADPKQWFSL